MEPLMIRSDDLKSAIRHLRRSPGFTTLAVAAIALGVGAVTAVFTLVSAVLLAPLPYPDAGSLWVAHLTRSTGLEATRPDFPFSYPKFETFSDTQKVFREVAAFTNENFNRTGTDRPERVSVEVVTPTYFPVLGARPELGRLFAEGSEDTKGGAPSALLSHAYWQRSFGGDRDVVGRTIEISHQSFTVVGVLPAGFAPLTGTTDLWLPLSSLPKLWDSHDLFESAGWHFLHVVARAWPGLDAAAVEAGAAAAGRRVAEAHPTDPRDNDGAVWGGGAETLAASRADADLRRSLLVLLAAVTAVLLVACANVAALLLARAVSRRREMAVRASLGADRRSLLALGLAESSLLAIVGGAAGLLLARALGRGLVVLAPVALPTWGLSGADLDRLSAASIDWRVALFACAATFATALLAGLAPAREASRTDPALALREGGGSLAGGGGHGRHNLRRGLVVAQTAAAVVLLIGAGLLVRTLGHLLAIDPGFHADSVLTVRILPSEGDYDRTTAPLFHRQLVEQMETLGGVSSASLGTCTPLSDSCNETVVVSVDGAVIPRSEAPNVGAHNVAPGYFRTLGIGVLEGREFLPSDLVGSPRVAILDRSAAAKLFPGIDPLGHRLRIGMAMKDGEEAEVVGLVDDVRYGALAKPPGENVYLADYQSGWASATLFVRTKGDPLQVLPGLREVAHRIAPDLPLTSVRTMREQAARASSRTRFATLLLTVFAGLALVLASLGIYGVLAQIVADRRRELGLRMVLGADRRLLRRLVLGQGLKLAGLGVAIGIPIAGLAGHTLASLLYGVPAGDLWTYLSVPLVALAAAAVACWLPARRASRLDPATVLREE